MGRIAIVESVERAEDEGAHVLEVQCNDAGSLLTAEHYASSGEDAPPLPGDSVALEDSAGAGRQQVSGYIDTKNPSAAAPGERRTYARDANTKEPVAEIWMKGDGSILITVLKSGGAPITVKSDGPVLVQSPDVRLGPGPGGRKVACVGDIVSGSIKALSTAPGSPIAPVPPATPTPTLGVPFVGQIISGVSGVEAG
jgi:hypothetical protein